PTRHLLATGHLHGGPVHKRAPAGPTGDPRRSRKLAREPRRHGARREHSQGRLTDADGALRVPRRVLRYGGTRGRTTQETPIATARDPTRSPDGCFSRREPRWLATFFL